MQNIKTILGYTSQLKHYFWIIAFCSIVSALVSLATPFIIKLATDWIVGILTHKHEFDIMPLVALAIAQILITFLGVAATDIGGWYGDTMAIKTRQQLSRMYYQHLLNLPQNYYDNEVTGKIINRLSRAISDITQFLQFFSNNLLQMLLTMGITIVILLFYSWPIAVLFVMLIPVNLYLTGRTSGKWQQYEAEKNSHFDIASGRFAEVVGQIRLVKSFRTEKNELKSFQSRMSSMVSITKKQSKYWHVMNALRGTIFGLIFAAIFTILFYETAVGKLTLGDMTMLVALVSQVSFPLRNLSFFVDSYQRAVANSKDFIAAMSETAEPNSDSLERLSVNKAKVEYNNVDFAYGDKKKVLHDISFTIEPGQKLALVGESGGGKTTISNLLMKLYLPENGTIKIDGQNIASVSKSSLRKNIATVFQDPALFSGTVRENIAYAKPEATNEEIEKAAKSANAHEFIAKLDKGYDTEIGERGIKLSGGQKQRIAIARALLKNAPILILDEATSSLDSRSEAMVQEALDKLMKKRTVMIIAHRLSTIAGVDKIVTLKNGRVDEVGDPTELSKSGGIYAQLLELQLGATEKAKKKLQAYDIAN